MQDIGLSPVATLGISRLTLRLLVPLAYLFFAYVLIIRLLSLEVNQFFAFLHQKT
jgi:hypothetical protein